MRGRFAFVMGVSGIVLGSLLTGVMEWRWERSAEASARRALQLTALRIAGTLAKDLEARKHEIQVMAELIGRGPLDAPDLIRDQFDRLQAREPGYAWIGLAAADGRVIAASGGLLEAQDVSMRPWFQAGLRGAFVGEPHEARLLAGLLPVREGGEPLRFMDVAMPVGGGALGPAVLGAHLHWSWVRAIAADAVGDLDRAHPVEVVIANAQGQWMLRLPTSAPDGYALPAEGSGTDRYLSAEAPVRFPAAATPLVWTVTVREEARLAHAPIADSRRVLLLLTGLAALLFAVASWFLAERVVRPIVALADAARAHRSRRAVVRDDPADAGRDETGVVGDVLHQMAFYDALTGLANRRLLHERLSLAIPQGRAAGEHGAILLVDLDGFRLLNDTRGHETGDLLLVEVARRLASVARPGDTLARLGGDEFVLLMRGLDGERAAATRAAQARAEAIVPLILAPVRLGEETASFGAAIGICLFGDRDTSAADLLQQAEVAMFEAKRSEHARIRFFDDHMQAALDERVLLEARLRQAIPSELVLVVQRQVDARARVIGAEVLVRWNHPVMGMVSPARFIPLAEDTGLIVPMGRWVLASACAQIARWRGRAGLSDLTLAVNVSAREFRHPGFVDHVLRTLDATRIDATRLKLELTESILADDVDAVVRSMSALKARGVQFSLDDFGTGFSSLAYLQRMPLDQLKIDQSFVRSVVTSAGDASIVRTVIALGRGLGLEVIAEGVETEAQRAFLADSGCDRFQGYLFGRPVPVDEFERGITAD